MIDNGVAGGNGNDEVGGGDGKPVLLKLNPDDSSLWFARDKNLYHYDREGQLLERIRLPKRAKALALDPTRDEVWVAPKPGYSATMPSVGRSR